MQRSPISRILVIDRFSPEALHWLRDQGFQAVHLNPDSPELDSELGVADAVILRSRVKVDSGFLNRAPKTRLIVTATSGFDHLDLRELQRRGVRAAHTPMANVDSTAELTWTLALGCARRIRSLHNNVVTGDWTRAAATGTELAGKTYAVVGYGRIGSRVLEIARAFRMRTIACDPYVDESLMKSQGVEPRTLEQAIEEADVLSLHVPRTASTAGLLTDPLFEKFKPSAILINSSRGEVIRERALLQALQNGKLRSVGLDVYEREPLPKDHPLLSIPNVILSPHAGAATPEAFEKSSWIAAKKVVTFQEDGSLEDELPPKADWFEVTSS